MDNAPLKIIADDPWLEPFQDAIQGRHLDVMRKLHDLTQHGSLVDFANAYNYFGLHKRKGGGFVFREYAPNASSVTLIGDF